MSKTDERCFFCDHQAEYDQVVRLEESEYTVSGVCSNHLLMGLSSLMKNCSHTWYMRLEGITCTKCLTIWDKEMDTNSASLDA